MQDAGCERITIDSVSRIQDPESRIQNPASRIPHPVSNIDTGCRVRDITYQYTIRKTPHHRQVRSMMGRFFWVNIQTQTDVLLGRRDISIHILSKKVLLRESDAAVVGYRALDDVNAFDLHQHPDVFIRIAHGCDFQGVLGGGRDLDDAPQHGLPHGRVCPAAGPGS